MDTPSLLTALRAAGYRVSVHRIDGATHLSGQPLPVPEVYVEMHAVDPDVDPPEVYVARVEGSGAEVEHRCAAELAQLAGVGYAPIP